MGKTRILLAEDNADHQMLLRLAMARGSGDIDVITADDGDAFLRLLREQTFDCVVIDYNLPDCQADELLRELDRRRNRCPAIVISSSRDQGIAVKTIRNGGVDFVNKTEAVVDDTLWRRIDHAVTQHRRSQARRRMAERRTRRLAHLADTDPLTGLPNRRGLARYLGNQRRHAYDRRGHVTVMLVDIDHFKRINDGHGHAVGDQVLRAVASAIQEQLDDGDIPCRWGGEEFLILRKSSDQADAVAQAECLRDSIERIRHEAEGHSLSLTVSVGLVSCAASDLSDMTFAQADRALYLAKAQGRNRVCTWEMVLLEEDLGALSKEPYLTAEGRIEAFVRFIARNRSDVHAARVVDHSQRVAELADTIAEVVGLEPQQRTDLWRASLCHDFGMLLVSAEILTHPASLSPDQKGLVDACGRRSTEIAERLGASATVLRAITVHHERRQAHPRLEDPGSPGLAEGRILSIADALDAMTSERAYRAAFPIKVAVAELKRERGRQFDPELVDVVCARL